MSARDEQIVSLFQAGRSQRAIARLTGLSQPGIRKRLLRLGLLSSVPLASRDNPGPGENQGRQAALDNRDNLAERGSDNRALAAPTPLKVLFNKPRRQCLVCGGIVKARGFLLCEENRPLGNLCLRCLVFGPQVAAARMRAYTRSLTEVADHLAKLDGEGWNPVGIILRLPPLHPGGPSLPR